MVKDFTVYVSTVKEGGRARYVKGYALLEGKQLPFTGLVLETHGGPSLGARFTKRALRELKIMGVSKEGVDELTVSLQMKIFHGEVILPEKTSQK